MTTLNIRTIDKQTITLSGSSMTTVADVARLLEEQHQFEINCQQLMLCGRVLSEEEKIETLQLTKKSFLLLLMKDKVEEEEATDTHAMEIQRQQREHQQHQSDLRMAQRINQKRTTKSPQQVWCLGCGRVLFTLPMRLGIRCRAARDLLKIYTTYIQKPN